MAAFKAALVVLNPAQATYYVEVARANLKKAEALIRERKSEERCSGRMPPFDCRR